MKMTYLINSYLPDGSTELVETTREHWRKIIKENNTLPQEKQRFFYVDVIRDSSEYDCIIMEVDITRFKKWNNENRTVRRNWLEKKRYSHISLDTLFEQRDSCIISSQSIEEECIGTVIIDELRKALACWHPWGPAVLDMYLAGQKKDAFKYLMQKYGESRSSAFRHKKDFEEFLKKFLLR